jgi:hypothetical protein
MIEFVEYSDEKIRIKLPKQLRQKHSIRFFQGNIVRGKPKTQVTVGIDIDLNASAVKAVREVFLGTRVNRPATLPKGYKVERSGKCSFGDGGLELFTSSEIFDKRYTLYTWDVLYRLQGCYVMLNIMGGGSRESFENMAKEIIMSLKLLSPTQSKKRLSASTGSMIKSVKDGGLKTKEKARLACALESLPDDLKYLRGPILAIADEDQGLLGCGEADTTLLAGALQQQTASHPSGFAAAQAEELEEWLKGILNTDEAWATPVWFVLGFLAGYDMFGEEQQV